LHWHPNTRVQSHDAFSQATLSDVLKLPNNLQIPGKFSLNFLTSFNFRPINISILIGILANKLNRSIVVSFVSSPLANILHQKQDLLALSSVFRTGIVALIDTSGDVSGNVLSRVRSLAVHVNLRAESVETMTKI
jgi:hypothetical protein